MGVRFGILIAIFLSAYSFLLFHLYGIQLRSGDQYLAQAESQELAANFEASHRGAIYFVDKDGEKIAVALNKDFPHIYAVPKVMKDPEGAAETLAPIFDKSKTKLAEQFSNQESSYVPLAKKASTELVNQVKSLGISGIYVRDIPDRFYPFGTMAAQLLGYVGPDDEGKTTSGKYGLEKLYDSALRGESGQIKNGKISLGEKGEDIVLTIDPNIQREAEKIISSLVQSFAAKSGTVIVEDPKTGKILTLANYPNFDPNNYSDSDVSVFLDPATEKLYEPGSVFKVLTMSAGIDTGKITPDTTFNDTGVLMLNGKKIENWDLKAHGVVTMTRVIELSLNTGAAFAERQTGDKIFREYIQKFGFGEKTGVDLPGELKGDIRNLDPKSPPIAFATASFGQGVAVTPIQLINAIAAIANGGNLMQPYVNAEMEPKVIRRVIKESTANQVTQMMISAVDEGKLAKVNGYTIAGKTGTAQVPDLVHGGYTDRVINTYVGFGPTSDPKFILLVRLIEPQGAPLAGQSVVPAFRDLAQYILNYYNVPPDRIDNR